MDTILTILDFILNKNPLLSWSDGSKTKLSSYLTAAVSVATALSGVFPFLTGVATFLTALQPLFLTGIAWGLSGKVVKKLG